LDVVDVGDKDSSEPAFLRTVTSGFLVGCFSFGFTGFCDGGRGLSISACNFSENSDSALKELSPAPMVALPSFEVSVPLAVSGSLFSFSFFRRFFKPRRLSRESPLATRLDFGDLV